MKPRWTDSQRAVEAALLRGPLTVKQLCDATGYTTNTVKAALKRCRATRDYGRYPAVYRFGRSAFEGVVMPPVESEPEVRFLHVVEPLSIPMEELGPRWQENVKKLGDEVASIDLRTLDLKTAIKYLEVEVASLLGALLVLREVKDGPDWREQIGLEA